MARYVMMRLGWLLFMLWFIMTVLFFSLHIGMWRFWFQSIPLQRVLQNAWTLYLDYGYNVLTRWDWGRGRGGVDAWELMSERARISLRINLITLAVYITFSILLGYVSSRKENGPVDRLIQLITLLFISIPNYLWAWFLIFFVGFRWGWLPPQPHGVEGTLWGDLLILVIPVTALALYPLGKLTALFRGEFLTAQRSLYSTLLKVKGLTAPQMARRHWFKDALVPILSEIPSTFVFVLSSSFLIERYYSINGVTLLFFNAMFAPQSGTYVLSVDFPMAMTTTIFFIFLSLSLALTVDIVNAWLDPRIRLGSKKASIQ